MPFRVLRGKNKTEDNVLCTTGTSQGKKKKKHKLTTASDYDITIQLTKFISSSFDLRNILLSNENNET